MKNSVLFAVLLAGTVAGSDAAATHETYGFDFRIVLSEKAAHRLEAAKEGLAVSASYYGDPAPNAKKHADEVGHIDLGQETLDLPGVAGEVKLSGRGVEADRLKWVKGPVHVNVNVFSARKSSEDNILNCDFIDGELAKVARSRIALRCALIEENYQNQLKPQ